MTDRGGLPSHLDASLALYLSSRAHKCSRDIPEVRRPVQTANKCLVADKWGMAAASPAAQGSNSRICDIYRPYDK
jgi:hypothetical protein